MAEQPETEAQRPDGDACSQNEKEQMEVEESTKENREIAEVN